MYAERGANGLNCTCKIRPIRPSFTTLICGRRHVYSKTCFTTPWKDEFPSGLKIEDFYSRGRGYELREERIRQRRHRTKSYRQGTKSNLIFWRTAVGLLCALSFTKRTRATYSPWSIFSTLLQERPINCTITTHWWETKATTPQPAELVARRITSCLRFPKEARQIRIEGDM